MNRFNRFAFQDCVDTSAAFDSVEVGFDDELMVVEVTKGNRDKQIINVYYQRGVFVGGNSFVE